MKKTAILLAIILTGSSLFSPDLLARGRQSAQGRPAATAPASHRPGGNNQRPGGNNQRPGGNNHRPGGNNQRPGGNNRPATPRPPQNNNRPGGVTPGRPNMSHRPPRPNTPPRPHRPPRPHTPPRFHYHRPTPPPTWRPYGRMPSFGSILGITLGTAIANSISNLISGGYTVSGYTNNEVYLSNVIYDNLNWPEVTMHYQSGVLVGSTFSYSSSIYDTSRYNYVYNSLIGQYGSPISTQSLSNGGFSATWWGNNNRYITLSFIPEYNSYGSLQYYTTVSLGN